MGYVIVHQLTNYLAWWQHIMPLVSDYLDRNLLIALCFLFVITSDGLGSQLLRYQPGYQ